MSDEGTNRFRLLPSVDRVLATPALQRAGVEPSLLVRFVREELASIRAMIAHGYAAPDVDAIVDGVLERTRRELRPSLRPVINATGVILHTNLGRAPLSRAALEAMEAAARGYTNLEFDLDRGERGSRHGHLDGIVRQATGAEAVLAVNNNAAALVLVLSALCAGREVVISRGQLVEIGGGFRIPDVMRQSGVRLVEVGTTNRTYVGDYVTATTADTAAYLRVHSSNFRVIGFTTSPELPDLARAVHARGLMLLDDIGSGALLETSRYGLAPEPTVQESLAGGADLVLFSGDKLLGGPQAGIIAGGRALVEKLRRHPLSRALRLDRVTIAALEATFLHYVRGEAEREVPVWRMIAASREEIERRAFTWRDALGCGEVVGSRAMIGGGSLPEESVPSSALSLRVPGPDGLMHQLRLGDPPVVGRIERDAVLLDPRTVDPADDGALVEAVRAALPPA